MATANTSNTKANNKNTEKKKQTFMLHKPDDMISIGRFVTNAVGDWRAAALKAASRGHTRILLRKTGTKEVREYEGRKDPIEPKTINRGDRQITYTHRPAVKFVKSFIYEGATDPVEGTNK